MPSSPPGAIPSAETCSANYEDDAASRPVEMPRITLDIQPFADAYDSAVDPAATPQLHETSSQAGANGLTAGSCEATCRTYDVASFTCESAGAARHVKKPKITPACSSEFHSFDASIPDCAVLPLPLPSLVVPSPACCSSCSDCRFTQSVGLHAI